MRVAILIDGGFFLRRYRSVLRQIAHDDAAAVADAMYQMATSHLWRRRAGVNIPDGELYRIFFYDCPPLTKRVHCPVSRRSLNLRQTREALFRIAFDDSLKSKRKVALRLGRLDERNAAWQLREGVLAGLLRGTRDFATLQDEDFVYYARQKIVDTKIGLDIALLTEKKLVQRIVLIAGDSDFVPAAKHARREGIDFILDPMWNPIAPELHEHIDGLRSTAPNPHLPAQANLPLTDPNGEGDDARDNGAGADQ
jgi:uncharacterized LabA/DUF88 family protein